MSKSRDAFRTISEVADLLDTPAHVLRFWESKFTQVKPVKRAGGRRYYRPADISLLSGIRTLLYDDGLTIKGVQKVLREQGVKHVAALAPLQLDEPEETDADAIEDAPFIEAQAESGTVLPFAPMTAPRGAEAPVAAVTPQGELAQSPQTATSEADEPAVPVAEAEAPMPDAEAPAAEAEAEAEAEMVADIIVETEAEPHEEPYTDVHGTEHVEATAERSPESSLSETPSAPFAEMAEDGPTIAEQDGPVPDFLAHSLEDRQADAASTPTEPSDDETRAPDEATPTFDTLPEQPYGAHPEPNAEPAEAPEAPVMAQDAPAAFDAPQDSPADPVETDATAPAEAPEPVSRALPDLPDLAALPVPPAGALRHIARLDRLGVAEAQALAAPVAALRDWLARSDNPARQ
ncbi:MerR family transcriptional regulator [Salipiger bermudensis]|uniref:MerR family transcriptional regulator n=1 Tax=Salipiger bermudensis TaxID=344736 RepID=UPI001CD7BDC0|nr:MerR family transcriptional regulator [Salipiger bermudensis]MCA0964380.1 MerR family transcriptional regulator [Salipiger bermudensis]